MPEPWNFTCASFRQVYALSLESSGSSPIFRDSSLDYYTDISEMLRLDRSWITVDSDSGVVGIHFAVR